MTYAILAAVIGWAVAGYAIWKAGAYRRVAEQNANVIKTEAQKSNESLAARDRQLADLRKVIVGLEHDLETCVSPAARRVLVNKLLQASGSKA
jgi:hypothetical protein